ncbi:anthranilate synthase component I family protein [Ferruginibacter sp. HRS2-29]|uniref:anthranilate synthase component I family protein n=1 Tax=Ferruginibacter sp. HRS2-29 TaxID=2487334 RepID=UPI0020CBA94B|nr:anthranilate synthase component I family protein [Ferruginibacter sp. HRS2-29]MCP9752481.1 anthranilate synthase component I family protein [Ferruginibacter sp. HRS2-29]
MKKITFVTSHKKMLADIFTPVGIYLRLRDKFRDTILLESTDFHAGENNLSIIGINAIGGIEITDGRSFEFKLPGRQPEKLQIQPGDDLPAIMQGFMDRFEVKEPAAKPVNIAQGIFGYTTYDAVQFFENIVFDKKKISGREHELIPMMRYRLYQYVIIIDHFKDELYLCENHFDQVESGLANVESIIRSKDVPVFPFALKNAETSNITDEQYRAMVQKGIDSCHRGDTFQIVLSRRFQQQFTGDEFNVYRSLRSINPSPYLFYFDYGDYKLTGSSPESQVIIDKEKVIVHPIAGTFKRSGDDDIDKQLAIQLEADEKENAEHVMLVDLARNDLSRVSTEVEVTQFKKVNYFSHVIHLVSEVQGRIGKEKNPFRILGSTFPAGTLSGAPKYKAMQLIDQLENTARGFYGGAIGFIGFNGNCNHAIMIRTFLSKNNTLTYQAGAGVVVSSKPESELQEVNNKLGALKKAISAAQEITF